MRLPSLSSHPTAAHASMGSVRGAYGPREVDLMGFEADLEMKASVVCIELITAEVGDLVGCAIGERGELRKLWEVRGKSQSSRSALLMTTR